MSLMYGPSGCGKSSLVNCPGLPQDRDLKNSVLVELPSIGDFVATSPSHRPLLGNVAADR